MRPFDFLIRHLRGCGASASHDVPVAPVTRPRPISPPAWFQEEELAARQLQRRCVGQPAGSPTAAEHLDAAEGAEGFSCHPIRPNMMLAHTPKASAPVLYNWAELARLDRVRLVVEMGDNVGAEGQAPTVAQWRRCDMKNGRGQVFSSVEIKPGAPDRALAVTATSRHSQIQTAVRWFGKGLPPEKRHGTTHKLQHLRLNGLHQGALSPQDLARVVEHVNGTLHKDDISKVMLLDASGSTSSGGSAQLAVACALQDRFRKGELTAQSLPDLIASEYAALSRIKPVQGNVEALASLLAFGRGLLRPSAASPEQGIAQASASVSTRTMAPTSPSTPARPAMRPHPRTLMPPPPERPQAAARTIPDHGVITREALRLVSASASRSYTWKEKHDPARGRYVTSETYSTSTTTRWQFGPTLTSVPRPQLDAPSSPAPEPDVGI